MHAWCDGRFGSHAATSDLTPRRYDIPWTIMDSSGADQDFGWRFQVTLDEILEQIAEHAHRHPDWLEMSGR